MILGECIDEVRSNESGSTSDDYFFRRKFHALRPPLTALRTLRAADGTVDSVLPVEKASMSSRKMAGKVPRIMLRSNASDFRCTYAMSRRSISLNVVLFFPLTCHRPVMPG